MQEGEGGLSEDDEGGVQQLGELGQGEQESIESLPSHTSQIRHITQRASPAGTKWLLQNVVTNSEERDEGEEGEGQRPEEQRSPEVVGFLACHVPSEEVDAEQIDERHIDGQMPIVSHPLAHFDGVKSFLYRVEWRQKWQLCPPSG